MAIQDPWRNLSNVVTTNLEHQQEWSGLTRHDELNTPRPILSGLPPRRLYVHPDEQIDIINAEKSMGGKDTPQAPEYEWVLPVHLNEKLSLKQFAAIFDSIDALPPNAKIAAEADDVEKKAWTAWRGSKRNKRFVLAIVEDDSTVAYYLMHDGIVKPRQN